MLFAVICRGFGFGSELRVASINHILLPPVSIIDLRIALVHTYSCIKSAYNASRYLWYYSIAVHWYILNDSRRASSPVISIFSLKSHNLSFTSGKLHVILRSCVACRCVGATNYTTRPHPFDPPSVRDTFVHALNECHAPSMTTYNIGLSPRRAAFCAYIGYCGFWEECGFHILPFFFFLWLYRGLRGLVPVSMCVRTSGNMMFVLS